MRDDGEIDMSMCAAVYSTVGTVQCSSCADEWTVGKVSRHWSAYREDETNMFDV